MSRYYSKNGNEITVDRARINDLAVVHDIVDDING